MEIHPRFMKCIENPCEVYLHRFWTEAELHKKKEGTEGLKNSIGKKKAQREVLQGGIRGTRVIRRISRIRVIRMAKGDKGDKEDKGNREKSVCSSMSTPNRTEAELHKKKKGTEGTAPRGG